jgi:hypothetical protein
MNPLKIIPIAIMIMLLMISSCKEAPRVTHPITDRSDSSCLVCHQGGVNGAPVTRHPKYKDCLSCHKDVENNEIKK